jgi:hypothetical protein
MEILFPRIALRRLPAMAGIAIWGAALAGAYGALHDQVSYTISPEYFTKLKFHQFSYANFGWPERVFAAEIGFLASWWVGLIGGWLLARAGLDQLPAARRRTCMVKAFACVAMVAVVLAAGGALVGDAVCRGDALAGWKETQQALGIRDLPGFVIVACLHSGSYLGGLVGIIAAVVYVRRCVARKPEGHDQTPDTGTG